MLIWNAHEITSLLHCITNSLLNYNPRIDKICLFKYGQPCGNVIEPSSLSFLTSISAEFNFIEAVGVFDSSNDYTATELSLKQAKWAV